MMDLDEVKILDLMSGYITSTRETENYDIVRSWRELPDSLGGEKILITEAHAGFPFPVKQSTSIKSAALDKLHAAID